MTISQELVDKARNSSTEKVILSLEQNGFCISLLKKGTTTEKIVLRLC